MKNALLFLSVIIFMTLSTSCEKNDHIFASTENKLQGEWMMDKVIFSPTPSFNQFNITNQFTDFVYTFDEGNNLSRSNTSTGETASGSYRIDTEVQYTGDEIYTTSEFLSGTLVDFTNQQVTLLSWRNLNVTRKKITANEQRDGGNYRYTLVRK